ncbi:MAG: hypothetical protein IPI46_09490 [Bacteroidetes bacterium]|nr:hypothetical protein [Bacteroidota bacterium]
MAINFTGTYLFSKGVNKASSTLMLIQFKPDSAFFILHAVSGMPDFFTTELKGFCSIDQNIGKYIGKSNASLQFNFTSYTCIISENTECKFDCSTAGKYRKVSSTIKKGNDFMPAFSDKMGIIVHDSISSYPIPHDAMKSKLMLHKNTLVMIHDEYNDYYLIETDKLKNEFLWVNKKYIQLKKRK